MSVRTFRLVLATTLLVAILASAVAAHETRQAETKLAAAFQLPQLPGLSGPSADWRQWDSFFTFVVKQFGQELSGDLKDSLGDVFLDSRYELTSVIASAGGQNPVPELFVNGWKRLSPVLNKALPGLSQQTASRYASFISAADKLAAVAPQASQLGLLQITPDALRGMARLVEPSGAVDPIAYNLNVDSALRNLLGFTMPLPAPSLAPGIRQSRFRGVPFPLDVERASLLPSRLDSLAPEMN